MKTNSIASHPDDVCGDDSCVKFYPVVLQILRNIDNFKTKILKILP